MISQAYLFYIWVTSRIAMWCISFQGSTTKTNYHLDTRMHFKTVDFIVFVIFISFTYISLSLEDCFLNRATCELLYSSNTNSYSSNHYYPIKERERKTPNSILFITITTANNKIFINYTWDLWKINQLYTCLMNWYVRVCVCVYIADKARELFGPSFLL